MKTVFLSIGSNLNDPVLQIDQSIKRIKKHPSINNVLCSALHQSNPLGPQDQPNFFNGCVRFQTQLSPSLLLDFCQWLEFKAERKRRRHWGERSLDVDILYIQNHTQERPWQQCRLTLPHPQYHKRDFVLIPLKEVIDDSWSINIDALCSELTERFLESS